MTAAAGRTLAEFARGEIEAAGGDAALLSIVDGLRVGCGRVASLFGRGKEAEPALAGAARDIFLRMLEATGHVAAIAFSGMEEPYSTPATFADARYRLTICPLDVESVDHNEPAGSIFSIGRAVPGSVRRASPDADDFLRAGSEQIAAGYALYGPSTMLVIVLGHGRNVNGFTLDRASGEFFLTHPGLRLASTTRAIALHASNARFWEPAVQRYVDECIQGEDGARGENFVIHGMASLAAAVHRILIRGGLILFPKGTAEGPPCGGLRHVYEANAMAMLIEAAGGFASTGSARILDIAPTALIDRVPAILGAGDEVLRLERYHRDHEEGLDPVFTSPLFNERSLFPPPVSKR